MLLKENIGKHIRQFRKQHGIKQAELGEYLGKLSDDLRMSQKQISALENGKIGITPELAEAMVRAGVFPDVALDLPEQLKMTVAKMDYDDQMLVCQFVNRLMR